MRVLLEPVLATRDGATITTITGDTVNHHTLDNTIPRVGVRVHNTDSEDQTITFQTPYQKDGLDLAERVETIPAGAKMLFGPFDKTTYGQADADHDLTGKNAVKFQVSFAMALEAVRIT